MLRPDPDSPKNERNFKYYYYFKKEISTVVAC
jgi:hypothetical protein